MYLPHWPIPSSLGNRSINYETVFLRMNLVLERLGNPHKKLPPIIHVTGTNGKGSTIAFMASILQAQGLKVHVYTSPHLHHCNERIVLDGEKISDNFLFETMEEARIGAGETPLTFFEGFTIGAFLAFANTPADLLLIECGMGARIDATNIIEKKLAAIITPISFDHTEYLGNSIAQIAFEKAHIIRAGTPVIVGPQPEAARKMIELIAQDQNAKLIRYDQEFSIIRDEENSTFDLKFFDREICNLPAPSLKGEHQYINAATAISCLLSLPLKISDDALKLGLQRAKWSSRFEKIENSLCKILKNKKSEIFIDGAHNASGAFALARLLQQKKSQDAELIPSKHNIVAQDAPHACGDPQEHVNKACVKTFVICGFSKNKCKKEFLLNFVGVADEIIAVRVSGEPYPEDSEKIALIAKEAGIKVSPCDDLLDAIHFAANLAGDEACVIAICGSLHLARDVAKFKI